MDAFLAQLASSATPPPDLFPSISHLVATLSLSSIPQLINALLASPVLSSISTSSSSMLPLKEAFKTAVDLKLVALAAQQDTRSSLPSVFSFGSSRTTLFDRWLASLLSAIINADNGRTDSARLSMLVGLLEGVRSLPRKEGEPRATRELEVEVAIGLDELFLGMESDLRKGKGRSTDGLPNLFPLAAAALTLLPLSSVSALSIKAITSVALFHASTSAPKSSLEQLKTILVLMVNVSTNFEARPHACRDIISQIVRHLSEQDLSDPSSDYIHTFLLPLSFAISQTLIAHPAPSPSSLSTLSPFSFPTPSKSASFTPTTMSNLDLSGSLLYTLYQASRETDAMGGLESEEGDLQYGRTWWGLVDVLLSKGERDDRAAWKGLLERMKADLGEEDAQSDRMLSKVNNYLLVAEQVIPLLKPEDESFIESVILPICERYIEDPSHLALFESAHSTMLAILSPPPSARKRRLLSPEAGRSPLKERLVLSYADTLLKNASSDQLSIPQLQHAFLILLSLTSTTLPLPLTVTLLSKLTSPLPSGSTASPSSLSSFHQNLLQIHSALLPSIPTSLLPSYLSRLEENLLMMTGPRTELRNEMVKKVFDGIGELGDEGKVLGVGWWVGVREVLEREERRGEKGEVRARL